ncbi:MAG: hypothetical protein KY467_01470 [Gemmatimonadetes bacterium]|nr:hypothetical protein [Gemmatimonadota bacterium]
MHTILASAINPSAGVHPVTASAAELRAVESATEASLREAPYYLERYGERGRLFGASDGGWLVTLCRGDADFVERQVLWLGRVLASRGMPRWLLQRHLELLHDALTGAIPEHGGRYRALLDGAALLRDQQRQHLAEADARALAAAFDAEADADWVARLPGMGRILAAAVADEAAGIANAVDSVEEWVTDPARFPDRWINAVQSALAAGRRSVRRGG